MQKTADSNEESYDDDNVLCFLAEESFLPKKAPIWVIYPGATSHMYHEKFVFLEPRQIAPTTVKMGADSDDYAKNKGRKLLKN